MRTEIMDNDLEAVAGGKVYLSGNKMLISFTTLQQTYKLNNCTYTNAKKLVMDLFMDNDTLSDEAFDQLVRERFAQNGWISI